MKTLLIVLLGALQAYSQLNFKQLVIEHNIDPATGSTTVSFPFTVTTDTEILGSSPSCGCMVSKLPKTHWKKGESGDIRVKLDTSEIKGNVTKSLDLKFANHPEQRLKIKAFISKAITWEPKSHIWDKEDSLTPKTFEIIVSQGQDFQVTSAIPIKTSFKTELIEVEQEEGATGRKYNLTVTPPQSEQKEICMIKVSTDSELTRYKSFNLLAIKR